MAWRKIAKKHSLIIALCMAMIMAGCSKYADESDLRTASLPEQTETPEEETIVVVPQEHEYKKNNVGSEDMQFVSVSAYLKGNDQNWNDSAEYARAARAYDRELTVDNLAEDFSLERTKIGCAYIDEDDIPEILISDASSRPDGVAIYTYLPKSDTVSRVGEFGDMGRFYYYHKGNRIVSRYGNGYSFDTCFTKIEDGKAVLVGMVSYGQHQGTLEEYYYAGFPYPENVDGTTDTCFDLHFEDRDGYRVSKEEYEKKSSEFIGKQIDENECIEVYVDDMDRLWQ